MIHLPVPIPSGYQILVKENQKISKGDVIASSQSTSQNHIIELAKDLEVNPKDAQKYLIKNLGDRIEAGQTIAKKSGIMGSREVGSKVSGTILNYNSQSGELTISSSDSQALESSESVKSPVDGTVVSCDNEKVVLSSDKDAVVAIQSSGESAQGEAIVLEGEISGNDLDDKVSGKIIVAKSIDREAVAKAMVLKAIGIVSQEVSQDNFDNLVAKKIKTPVMKVDEDGFRKLSKKNENLVLDCENNVIIKL